MRIILTVRVAMSVMRLSNHKSRVSYVFTHHHLLSVGGINRSLSNAIRSSLKLG